MSAIPPSPWWTPLASRYNEILICPRDLHPLRLVIMKRIEILKEPLTPTAPSLDTQAERPKKVGNGPSRKLFIRTFGCQMNEYDSDKMIDVLNEEGPIHLTDDPTEADIILFNTCSVREKAQEKVFSDLGRVRHLKEENPNLVIGVGGCVASQEGRAIVQRAPFVDVVFGPQTLHRLPELIQQKNRSGRAQVDISFPEIEKLIICPLRASRAPRPLCRSWRAVANIAAFVWSPTRVGPRSHGLLKTS